MSSAANPPQGAKLLPEFPATLVRMTPEGNPVTRRFERTPTSMAGIQATEPLAVRETLWGYIIRSDAPETGLRAIATQVSRYARMFAWVAVGAIWILPVGALSVDVVAMKTVASAMLLGLTYLGVSCLFRKPGHEFHVDLDRREIRTARVAEKGDALVTAYAGFDEVQDMVLRREKAGPETTLHVRLAKNAMLCVAQSDEATLRRLHDRLARDFVPLEVRLPGLARRARTAPSPRRAFAPLGPDEVSA